MGGMQRGLKRKSISLNGDNGGITLENLSKDERRVQRRVLKEQLSQILQATATLDGKLTKGINRPSGLTKLQVKVDKDGFNPNLIREKRTPKANTIYKKDFFSTGDKIPLSSKGSKGKAVSEKEAKRQKIESARNRRTENIWKAAASQLKRLLSHQGGAWFGEPVDPVKLNIPDYHQIIKHPMDLGTVSKRLESRHYQTFHEFHDDVLLTFNNAIMYNPAHNIVHRTAVMLRELFVSKLYPQVEKLLEEDEAERVREDAGLNKEITPKSKKKPAGEKPAPKPTVKKKAATPKENSKEMPPEQKRQLSVLLGELPADAVYGVVDIIKKRSPDLVQDEDEMELDIDVLGNETLWELQAFLDARAKRVKAAQKRKAPSKKPAEGSAENHPRPSKGHEQEATSPAPRGAKDEDKTSSSSSSSSASDSSSGTDSESGSDSGTNSEAHSADAASKATKAEKGGGQLAPGGNSEPATAKNAQEPKGVADGGAKGQDEEVPGGRQPLDMNVAPEELSQEQGDAPADVSREKKELDLNVTEEELSQQAEEERRAQGSKKSPETLREEQEELKQEEAAMKGEEDREADLEAIHKTVDHEHENPHSDHEGPEDSQAATHTAIEEERDEEGAEGASDDRGEPADEKRVEDGLEEVAKDE